jgi:hypothetical protein
MQLSGALRTEALDPRPIGVGWAIALSGAFAVLAIRVTETEGDPLGFVRILSSAFAIGVFFFVRRFSVVKGLLMAAAIEVATGSALFAIVDMPFIKAHAPVIAQMTVMSLERLERTSVREPATLAKL